MPTKRRRVPQPRRGSATNSDGVLRAFMLGDVAAIRSELGIPVWDNTPLATHRNNRCDYCRMPIDTAASSAMIAGCHNNHAMWALRLQLIGELEARGDFRWVHLDDPDDEVARVAWDRLGQVAKGVGVSVEAWVERLRRAGWDARIVPNEEESHGA
jgi:hypothetical protein